MVYTLEDQLLQATLVEEGSAYDAVAFAVPFIVNDVVVNYALVNKEYNCPEFMMSTEEGIRAALYAKEVGEVMASTEAEAHLIAFYREATGDNVKDAKQNIQ